MRHFLRLVFVFLWLGFLFGGLFAAPTVSNVTFTQRTDGSKIVDVYYDLADTVAGATWSVGLAVSNDGGVTYSVPVNSVTGAVGAVVTVGTGKKIVWDAGTDWPEQSSSQIKVQVRASDLQNETSNGFVKIPVGTCQIGDLLTIPK